jgi:hypothetical protein
MRETSVGKYLWESICGNVSVGIYLWECICDALRCFLLTKELERSVA